jgi:hypothetical protein
VSDSIPWHIPTELKTYVHTKTYLWMFTAALFIITKKWEQLKRPPTGEEGECVYGVFHTMEYYLAIKGDKVLIYTTTQINVVSIC